MFLRQLDTYFNVYGAGESLEIYNSGSFLDDAQISAESRVALFRRLAEKRIHSVTIESRPEYITKERIEPLMNEFAGKLTVAIGLEVADNSVLQVLNKGFNLKDVERAYVVLEQLGVYSRVYILVGPPFVKDPTATALESVRYAKEVGFTEVFLLGAYPMKGSAAFDLWKKKEWLPVKKDVFTKIVRLAQEIKMDIEFSSEDLERFWSMER
jgi:radical SAM enzyme (TIGR01210 family)